MSKVEFRRAAIEYEASSEQFKELIRLTTPRDWIILSSFVFIILVIILWGFFGKVPTYVQGQGILLGKDASIFDAVAPEGATRVISIKVKPGDRILKNDVIAYLDAPDLGKQVIIAQNYLQTIKEKYAALTSTSQEEIKQRQIEFDQNQSIEKDAIKLHTEELAAVTDLLQRKQNLEKRGIMTREQVMETLTSYYAVQKTLEGIRTQLIQNEENIANFKQDWRERLLKLELQIIDAQRDLDKLQNELALSKVVHSPVEGIVTNIQASIGDSVKTGDPIISIASEGKGLDAILFIPAKDGQRVKENMKALVSPEIIEKEKYGSLEGIIESVSSYPISARSMLAILHNKELVDRFMKNNIAIGLRATILSDPSTYSGYKWSSTNGPNQKVSAGMVVTAEVTVEKQAPFSLIIPAFKKFIEGEW